MHVPQIEENERNERKGRGEGETDKKRKRLSIFRIFPLISSQPCKFVLISFFETDAAPTTRMGSRYTSD